MWSCLACLLKGGGPRGQNRAPKKGLGPEPEPWCSAKNVLGGGGGKEEEKEEDKNKEQGGEERRGKREEKEKQEKRKEEKGKKGGGEVKQM